MVDDVTLHTRLDDLHDKILSACSSLRERKTWHDGHHLTSGELKARYAYLKSKVDADIHDLDVHGQHIGALETAVIGWIKGLDI